MAHTCRVVRVGVGFRACMYREGVEAWNGDGEGLEEGGPKPGGEGGGAL